MRDTNQDDVAENVMKEDDKIELHRPSNAALPRSRYYTDVNTFMTLNVTITIRRALHFPDQAMPRS
jgi:hypothetical protein